MSRNIGNICIWRLLVLSHIESSIPTFWYSFSSFLEVRKLCKSGLSIMIYISDMSRCIKIFYLGYIHTAIFQEADLYCLPFVFLINKLSQFCKFHNLFLRCLETKAILSKYHNLFLTCPETDPIFMFEGF